MNITIKLILLCLVCPYAFLAQRIEVQFSAKKIEVGEVLTVQYNLTNQNERGMIRQSFEPFQIVGGPSVSQSSQTSWVNGQVSQYHTNSYTVQLICKKMGKVSVPKVTFQLADGSKLESNSIDIEVVKAGTIPRQAQTQQPDPFDPFGMFGQDPFDPFSRRGRSTPQGRAMSPSQAQQQSLPPGVYTDASKIDLKKDVFARIHLNKGKCYVGEQLTASVKIYTAVNSKGFEAEKLPNFNSFWAQEIKLPEKLEMTREVIGGREFVSVEIKKILLFPTKPGRLEITPLKMKTVALVPISKTPQRATRQPRDLFEAIQMMMENDMGGFGGVEFKEFPYSFSSGSEFVEVLPLPSGAPSTFTGAVGTFKMQAFCDKKNLKTDETLNYTVEVNGSGNLPLINNPSVEWHEDLEAFDPLLTENYTYSPNLSGTKTWKYTVIPHNPGSTKTPSLGWTYFDIGTKKYVTLNAEATILEVTGNPTAKKGKGTAFESVNYAKQKIKEIQPYKRQSKLSNVGFMGLGLLPIILSLAILFIPQQAEEKERFASGKKVSARVKKQLREAAIYLDRKDKTAFYNEVTRAYWGYLGDRLEIEPSSLSKNNIMEKLRSRKVDETTIHRVLSLIENGEMGLYTQHGTDDMKNQYEQSIEVLSELDKQLS